MSDKPVKLAVGFITYGKLTAKYLPYFLPSLKNQTFKDFKILATDNSEEENNANREFIKKNYPEVEFKWAGQNLGFARAYNLIISRTMAEGAEYFLMLNPDMILEKDSIEKMVKAIVEDSALASISPKILKWDFKENKKTNVIDTCGIVMKAGLRFFDLGQNQIDRSQFDGSNILGPSGCAALYRLSALEKVKEKGKYFDELFFMYKEDCDLALRLKLAGFKSKLVPGALIYHDRSASGLGESDIAVALNRKNKSRPIKQWSFFSQQILFLKYWRRQNWISKLMIIWHELKIIVFALIFERYLFKELFGVWKLRKDIKIYN